MNTRFVIVAIKSWLFAGCIVLTAQNATAATNLADQDRAGRTIAKEKCAHPKKVAVQKMRNRFENVIDKIKTFSCTDYRVVVYEVHASGIVHELPMEVVLNGAIPKFLPEFSLGMDTNHVRTLLGPPYSETEKELTYSLNEERPGEDTITYRLVHGRLESIMWSWNVD